MWGCDLFSSMFLGGSSLLRYTFQSRYEVTQVQLCLGQPWFILIVSCALLRASTCTLRSDLVKMLADIVTTVTEHIVRGLFVWELTVKVDRSHLDS